MMAPKTLRLVVGHSGPGAGQMSHPKPLERSRGFPPVGGRGRSGAAMRRVQALPVIGRDAASAAWAALIRRRCASREDCAVLFGVTFQTACNWYDQFSCPTGDKVMLAQAMWPEEFPLIGGVA